MASGMVRPKSSSVEVYCKLKRCGVFDGEFRRTRPFEDFVHVIEPTIERRDDWADGG
jgi:hypothetical protein